MENILNNMLSLLANKQQNQEPTGIPIVAVYFNEEEKEKAVYLRNKKSSIHGREDKDSHAEALLLKDIKDDVELSLIVTIIPCDKCLEKILKHKKITRIYYIGDYKEGVKFKKYNDGNINYKNEIKIEQFVPKSKKEYELAKNIYYRFVTYSIIKYFYLNSFVKKILTKYDKEGIAEKKIDIKYEYASFTFCNIIKHLSKNIIEVDEKSKEFIINLIELREWWNNVIEPKRKNGKILFKYLSEFDFGIIKYIE